MGIQNKQKAEEEVKVEKKKPNIAKKVKQTPFDLKMNSYAESIGVEDNAFYPKFKDKERLVFNVGSSRYFVIRFVAKQLFNFRLSYKEIDN